MLKSSPYRQRTQTDIVQKEYAEPGRCAQMCVGESVSVTVPSGRQIMWEDQGWGGGRMLWGDMDFLPLFKAEEFCKRKVKGLLSGAGDNVPSDR